ncbi:hypothetical protein AX16_009522 [Volvariella volvacea WC 439]|nr:hypothetical protein AX16_009522 [Volvariella volvacea WC 439]
MSLGSDHLNQQDQNEHPPSKLPLYEASTQCRNWRYSPEKLASIRTILNEAAVSAIRNKIEANEPGSSADVSFLSADEEVLLVKLYITKITQLCGLFQFPEEVQATAITYLKRFYLKNTVMDWHPKNVMLTALFLATKTTNNPISLEVYTKRIKGTAPSDVLDLEFLVAQSLNFEFAAPFTISYWSQYDGTQNLPDGTLGPEVYDEALVQVRALRLTDAELIYTPSQIALAALSTVVPELCSQWLRSKLASNTSDSVLSANALESTLEDIKALITTAGVAPDVESVREVDRRLRLCKNPEKVVGSKLYLAKKAAEEREAEEKRLRKAESARQAMTGNDPFAASSLGEPKRAGLVDYDDDDDD